jgi:hypothetical protein
MPVFAAAETGGVICIQRNYAKGPNSILRFQRAAQNKTRSMDE